ncbi:MAG TPA: DUF2905 family protein [Acidimicrobiales bacterium]|nr:DUF2905 family protein [Acidimicrobiales bacterium]
MDALTLVTFDQIETGSMAAVRIYFPIVACIVVSVVATIILNLYLRWKR